ncbi:MAG: amidohydrolase family protein [Beijerinckiaceae bacterium]|nr:amidohydrolase family protein [Beijerinckiaceae bacterium]MCZ8300070.1 amidohydrolase family protein [Beijerinckiaceae bacterium]
MRIDAHQHFWALARGDYGWLTPELAAIHRDFGPADLAPLLAAGRIDRTILVQAAPTEAETRYLLDLAAQHESIAGVVGWTDFDAPGAAHRVAMLAGDRLLVGLRPMIHDIPDPDWMLGASIIPALRAMTAEGLIFDALVRPPHLSRLLVLADRLPELTIVVDHAAKPLIRDRIQDPWASDLAALARRPNVVVKLSGLLTEAAAGDGMYHLYPYIRTVMEAFGPERILFGSDWPVLEMAGTYADWLDIVERTIAGLSAEAQAAIMGGNAARIYLAKRGRR